MGPDPHGDCNPLQGAGEKYSKIQYGKIDRMPTNFQSTALQLVITVLSAAKAKLDIESPELELCTAAGAGEL